MQAVLMGNMFAYYIVREGAADKAFALREVPRPVPGPGQVLIKVEAFGINFADLMARKGLYRDRPPLPALIGYDVAGQIEQAGAGVDTTHIGRRVFALTRFGGYAEYAVAALQAVADIPANMDAASATALSTQYCTAWYAAEECVRIHPGDRVLIHAAAGGVGTALVQIAAHRGAEIFGTAGSEKKLEAIAHMGVAHPINYRDEQWFNRIREVLQGDSLDIVFDAIGGKTFRQGLSLLGAGGRMVAYGAASLSDAPNGFSRLLRGLSFGFYHPVQFLMPSKSLIGINMLRIGDEKPHVLQRCMEAISEQVEKGCLQPAAATQFPASQLAQAHDYVEQRRSSGKVALYWE